MIIQEGVAIPDEELSFSFSRSGGPGGQHVNKVSSRVTLHFDLAQSSSLTDEQKDAVRRTLAPRISKSGVLRVSSQRHRSQAANREDAKQRFAELLVDALAGRKPRRPTRVPKREKEKRLAGKKQKSLLKRSRSDRQPED